MGCTREFFERQNENMSKINARWRMRHHMSPAYRYYIRAVQTLSSVQLERRTRHIARRPRKAASSAAHSDIAVATQPPPNAPDAAEVSPTGAAAEEYGSADASEESSAEIRTLPAAQPQTRFQRVRQYARCGYGRQRVATVRLPPQTTYRNGE